jgi:metallo-beta-lactamase class B
MSKIGSIGLISKGFRIVSLKRRRRIWAYLPPDYHDTDRRFPVIYMHDAQNLFFPEKSAFGQIWEVPKTMEQLRKQGFDAIVIGIEHGGKRRIQEFSPWKHHKQGGGEGGAYAQWLAESLKPFVDKQLRTLPQAEHTALVGSSMGGLITLFAGTHYQHLFGKLGVFSPSLWFAPQIFDFVRHRGKTHPQKIYLLAGQHEGAAMTRLTEAMYTHLLHTGYTTEDLRLIISPDGRHSEWFWGRELPNALQWMFNAISR